MRVGSLFSGIGGIDLGLERAGMEVVWQSEIDPYCCRVLAKHWPHVPNLGDITRIDWSKVERPDLVCGGFPCQPVSLAGKRRAQADERWLWPEVARCVRDLRPRYVLLENVPGLLVRGMGDVLGDLAACGYDAEWDCIPAAAVGAPHRRDRVFIVARSQQRGPVADTGRGRGPHDGLRAGRNESGQGGTDVPDARGYGCVGDQEPHSGEGRQQGREGNGSFRNDLDGLRADVAHADLAGSRQGRTRPAGRPVPERISSWWLSEPDVGRVVARLSSRVDGGRLDAEAPEGGTGEILHALRNPTDTQALRWTARGLGGLQATEILLAEVCEHTGAPKALGNLSLEGTPTSRFVMRSLWFDGEAACPSCRREASEQRRQEHSNALHLVSRLLTCHCEAAWLDATGSTAGDRVARLRGLGNAVVPQVAQWIGERLMEADR